MIVIRTLLLFITSSSVQADSLPDLSKYFQEGYEVFDVQGKDIPLNQAENLGIEARENHSNACTEESCNVGHMFSSEATVNRQQKTEEAGFTKGSDGLVINNKGFLDKAMKTVKNADKQFDLSNGTYANCTSAEETVTTKSEFTCDQYYNMQTHSCMPRQIVEIDPKYNYVCSKKREVKEKVCTDVIKAIRCQNTEECDMQGLEPSFAASDMTFTYASGVLLIGTITNNYRPGSCAFYERDTKFTIKNKQLIKEFRLVQLRFDDHMQVKINDHIVFAGRWSANELPGDSESFYNSIIENNQYTCKLGVHYIKDTDIDLIPYLNEGRNKISIKVVVSGGSDGSIQIKATQDCCTDFDIQREEKCEYS